MSQSKQNDSSSSAGGTALEEPAIDLRGVCCILWEGKWVIVSIVAGITLLALVVAISLPNYYRAEALLAPNQNDASSGLSALAAQYGGLASLAGIPLDSGSADKTIVGLEILKSRKFFTEFVRRREILVPLMATKSWDPKSEQLVIDDDIYSIESNLWVRKVRPPRGKIPSIQEAYEEFSKILRVRQNKETGLVTISVEHQSPVVAKKWVDWLVHDINDAVMKKDVDEAQQSIDFLRERVQTTSLSELQGVFFRLIEEQMKTMMLAEVTDEYLLATIDPAVEPEEKSRPKRLLIVMFAFLLSVLIGIVYCMMGTPMRRYLARRG